MFENYEYKFIANESTANVEVYEYPPIDFCFVGCRGVGKTSLLASMAKELKKGNVSDFYIDTQTPEGRYTASELNNAVEDMIDMLDCSSVGEIIPMSGIAATQELSNTEERQFVFKARNTDSGFLNDKQFRFPFRFIDMPGGWYLDEAGKHEEVNDILTRSVVSFLAIDTPAMMEPGDAVHMKLNHADRIYDWYNENIDMLARQSHSVIVVLSRCEAFWDKKDAMLGKFKERYADLLGLFRKHDIRVCVVPVKTLGGVKFVAYDKSDRRAPKAQFMRTGDYAPENCVTPLKLAFLYGLVHVFDQIRANNTGFWTLIGNALGFTHFDNAENCVVKIVKEMAKIDDDTFWCGDELYR